MLYWSPTAIAYLPVLLLHLVSLGYLLLRGPKSRQTWLFCGWLGGMTVMVATQCAARVVYMPRLSGYLDWWGGAGGVTLATLALLQFAYHFPRPRYSREARAVLWLSLAFALSLFAWMAWEVVAAWPNYVTSAALPHLENAFTPEAAWQLYDFQRFVFGFAGLRDAGITSFKVFDTWQIASNLWILAIWLRKTVQFSTPAADSSRRPGLGRFLSPLRHPRGTEAHLSRAWALLMLLSPLPVVASILDAARLLPPGLFAMVHLLVLFAIVLTYINYAPEPTSVMVKLVGISLVTLLIILGLATNYALHQQQVGHTHRRQAELAHAQTLIAAGGDLAQLPDDVVYVATRPVAGLFTDEYRLLLARPAAPTVARLVAHDALLYAGLRRDAFPAQVAATHAYPWLGAAGMDALASDLEANARYLLPEATPYHRGMTPHPTEYVTGYTFVHAGTRYEIGYDYTAYRAALHREALPFLALLLGATALIVGAFPHAFRVGLVAPLTRLLEAVARVERGELRGDVPVLIEDEIGRLTHGFNHMVTSLRASDEALRALNLTLEQRVIDRTRDLATLYEVAALVNRTAPLETLLAGVLEHGVTGVGASAGLLGLREPESGRMSCGAAHGLSPADAAALAPLWAALDAHGDVLLIHDLRADSRHAGGWADGLTSATTSAYATLLAVPILGVSEQGGWLVLFGDTPFKFNVEDVELVQTLVEQLGIAIENARLRERAVETAALEERQRLARDLHDSVTQLLYSQTLFADAATKSLRAHHTDQVAHYLTRLSEAAHRALREMRLMLYRLRPPALAELGLVGALRRRLELVEQRAGILTHFACDCDCDPPLPDEVETTLYYIAEEALNNALKHAAAAEVWVALVSERHGLTLSVRDNGVGFDADAVAAGMGLQHIHERAAAIGGSVTITATPGQGAHLIAHLPITLP